MLDKPTKDTLAVTGLKNLFKSSTSPDTGESIICLPLTELHTPELHPFQVNDDEAMTRLSESIKLNGIQEPGIARPIESGGYELLCGNRHKRACEILGLTAMPVIVRNLDDDTAAITMVE